MTKAGCWFGWVKGFFILDTKSKGQKKSERWRWVLGRLKRKSYGSIVAPEKRTLIEATEERRKHAVTVAIATAAAAEAAVAAAHAAAEVVRLTTSSHLLPIFSKTDQNSAAIKIQSAFRAHLARKALRALKGLVKLQAIARGRAVRRQINTSLKLNHTPLETKQKTEKPRKITLTGQENFINKEKYQLLLRPRNDSEENELKWQIENSSKRDWDGSIVSKQEMESSWLRKQEAILKRERMKKYSFSHREKRNALFLEENTDSPCKEEMIKIEKWGNREVSIHETPSLSCSETTRFRPENEGKQSCEKELSLQYPPGRRSFCHVKHNSTGDESLMPNSPVFPPYMAVTESAKARTRSTSLPKQRMGFPDSFYYCSLQSRDEPSPWFSYNCESKL